MYQTIVFLYYKLPRQSQDNFGIKYQFYAIQSINSFSLVLNVWSFLLPDNPLLAKQSVTSSIRLLILLLILIDTVFPIYIIYLGFKYDTELALAANAVRQSMVTATLQTPYATTGSISSLSSPLGEPGDSPKSMAVMNMSFGRSKTKAISLKVILEKPRYKNAFATFLVRELCLEYLLFLDDAMAYREGFKPSDDSILHYERIWNEFLAPNAINRVEVPSSILQRADNIYLSMKQGGTTQEAIFIFDDAVRHVAVKLSKNYVTKFTASNLFPLKRNPKSIKL